MAFAESARSYGRRLTATWDLPHHRYRGMDVTVGAMAGAACAEWHLHALPAGVESLVRDL
jgi:hypothetical protein